MTSHTHHTVREAIRSRIEDGEWGLGALIPSEISLAEEYGCARTTINRALQTLASEGIVVRKRKGGTRVCEMPARRAKLEISIVRKQVEAAGCTYRHQVLNRALKAPPSSIRTRLRLAEDDKAMYLETIHLSDDRPFAFEERWVNVNAVPEIINAPFDTISINEWLVKTVPFSSGDLIFSAANASQKVANAVDAKEGDALFVLDRTTWMNTDFITTMKLFYKDGYRLYTQL